MANVSTHVWHQKHEGKTSLGNSIFVANAKMLKDSSLTCSNHIKFFSELIERERDGGKDQKGLSKKKKRLDFHDLLPLRPFLVFRSSRFPGTKQNLEQNKH